MADSETESISGAARLPSDRDLLHNLADAARALTAALPLTRGAVAGSADVIVSALLLGFANAGREVLIAHGVGDGDKMGGNAGGPEFCSAKQPVGEPALEISK